MEDLTKQQIVLVTLLVSFVTSIATGIVTVSLMEQAPVGVTQTINQVVERTIEKVIVEEAPQQKANAATTVIKETIVVSAEDQAVKAVEKNKNSVVKIKSKPQGYSNYTFVGLGVIVSNEGLVLSDRGIATWGAKYVVELPDGTEHPLTLVENKKDMKNSQYEIALFKPLVTGTTTVTYRPAVIGNAQSLKLGQNVIALSGKDSMSVSAGIVQSFEFEKITTGTSTATEKLKYVLTSIDPRILGGSPLFNLNGELVGIKITPATYTTDGIYLPSSRISEYIEQITKVEPTPQ